MHMKTVYATCMLGMVTRQRVGTVRLGDGGGEAAVVGEEGRSKKDRQRPLKGGGEALQMED